jgi:hypothetical protein
VDRIGHSLPQLTIALLCSCSSPSFSARSAGSRYAFDIFALPLNQLAQSFSSPFLAAALAEVRLTDGVSVNYNGNFAPSSDALLFVSERNGSHNLYLSPIPEPSASRREALEDDDSPPLLP